MDDTEAPQHVHDVRLHVERNRQWSEWALLMADVHWDHPVCDRTLLKRHLEEARERGARVFVFGDMFDLMNGRFDPRRSMMGVRPEYRVDDYYDAVINDAVKWWRPYAEQLELLTYGNHETAVIKNAGTDPIQRMGDALDCTVGTYTGWVRFMFSGMFRQSITVWYHHGHGGGGVVTKGTLWPQRRAAWYPDANIVFSGHIHEQFAFPITRLRISDQGVLYRDMQMHLQIPTYKDTLKRGMGFEAEKGFPPKPVGAWWIRFHWNRRDNRIRFEETRAT